MEALARAEALYRASYDALAAVDGLQPEVDALRAQLAEVEGRRTVLLAEVDKNQNRLADIHRQGAASGPELKELAARWQYLSPTRPGYADVMRRRAARGHLPPGKTLADYGLRDE